MDGPLQKVTLHVAKGYRVHFDLVECLGEETIESLTERDPNLEEAYVSILGPTRPAVPSGNPPEAATH